MIRKIIFSIFFILFSTAIISQNIELSTILISQELSEDANSVIRFENVSIVMHSQSDMTLKVEKAITIYNKHADQYADITIYYDERTAIKNVSGYIYNALGNEIEKIRKKDFDDYSASGGSLFSDSRVINYDYTPTTYPYTIYYEYEIKTSNTAFIRRWRPISTYYQSVQKSKYSFTYPSNVVLNKSEKNFNDIDIISTEKIGLLTYEISNIPVIEYEPYAPSLTDITPNVKLGVNKFNLEGVNGEANNWEEFGKWYYDYLLQDTFDLPESTKNEIRSLTSGVDDSIEKAKIVYKYVQDKVRYISVQVGIGGFKPMLASEVDKLSYGDCKALTNYTKTLLDAIGIESYHTLLYRDSSSKMSLDKDVAAPEGNHMFLYLPISNQELWLECTSQKLPFADIGYDNDDRDVLVITPEGGKITHTRVYKEDENLQKITGKYVLDNSGHIKANVDVASAGTQFGARSDYENSNNKELEKLYKEFWDNINNIKIDNIKIKNNKKEGKFEERVVFTADNYGVVSGERMIFPINAFNVWNKAPKRMRNRKLPVEINRGFYDVDEIEIELPSNYTIEAISDDVVIDSEYGTYKLSVEKISESSLKYKRELLLKNGNYPKEAYDDYRDFWREVVKSDKSKIVLIKK